MQQEHEPELPSPIKAVMQERLDLAEDIRQSLGRPPESKYAILKLLYSQTNGDKSLLDFKATREIVEQFSNKDDVKSVMQEYISDDDLVRLRELIGMDIANSAILDMVNDAIFNGGSLFNSLKMLEIEPSDEEKNLDSSFR